MAKKSTPKNVDNSGRKSGRKGTLVPQKHGGAIKQGGDHYRPGRPPQAVRTLLLNEAVDGMPILREILGGQVVKRAAIPLSVVLKHATCPKCKGALERKPDDPSLPQLPSMVTLEGLESASPGDRVRAWDSFAKYGIGTKDEVTLISPDVRARLERTVQLIAGQESWSSETLLARLDSIWQDEG